METPESTESRFAHLLKPIRELTKNWDLDVAKELNDYLEELEDMCITFDGGETSMDFAEAAMLIQGSACIYSRKVVLLHSLVFQTLEYINEKKRSSKQLESSQEEDGEGASRSPEDRKETTFTSLDISVSDTLMKNTEKTSVQVSTMSHPVPDLLIPIDDAEKDEFPLISVSGDVLFSHLDFEINLYDSEDQDQVLLTLGSAGSQQLDQGPAETGGDAVDGGGGGGGDAADDFVHLEDHMDVDQDHPMDQDQGQNVDQDQVVEEHVDRQQAEGRTLRDRRQLDVVRAEMETPQVNAWTLHDPFAVIGEDKPFTTGKVYKVPAGLDDGGKRKRKSPSSLMDFRTWFRKSFDPPEQKLKNGPKFPDLNYIYLSTMRNRLKSRRRICRKEGVVVSEEELRRSLLEPEEAEPQPQGAEPVEAFRAEELLGDDGAGDSDNEQEVFPDELPAEFQFIPPDATDNLNYEELVKLRFAQLMVNCADFIQETELSKRIQDWEDKIRPELVHQEERPVFDIQDYGERVIRSLDHVGQRRSFRSIVSGLDQYEVCKYLLASLQLANDYMVDVDSLEGLEESVDSMGLTLLTTDRATDRFKAPPPAPPTSR